MNDPSNFGSNKPRVPFISEHRKTFLDIKDDLSLLEEVRQMPSSKRRDILLDVLNASFAYDVEKTSLSNLTDSISSLKIEFELNNKILQRLKSEIKNISDLNQLRHDMQQYFWSYPRLTKIFGYPWSSVKHLIDS